MSMREIYEAAIGQEKLREAEALAAREAELRAQLGAGAAFPLYRDLAAVLERRGATEEALRLLRHACDQFKSAEAFLACARQLGRHNRAGEAIETAASALRLHPADFRLRLVRNLTLPSFYGSTGELEKARASFDAGLGDLEAAFGGGMQEHCFEAIGGWSNFYLPYQMRDDLEFQVRYASLVEKVLHVSRPDIDAGRSPVSVARQPGQQKIRVAYISPFLHFHSVAKAYTGWITGHQPEEFEVFVYHLKPRERMRESLLSGRAQVRVTGGDISGVVAQIRADRPDVAILLDVGMDPLMTLLSVVRLAPVQCATWGHPVTTGSRQVDYFLSSDTMEPAGGERHYAEQLIRLPGVGVCYPRPMIPRALLDLSRSRFGLREGSVVYVSPHTTFKLLPAHDAVYAAIAAQVADAQFVFVASAGDGAADLLQQRLDHAFAVRGLRAANRCVILPFLGLMEYFALLLVSDIYLDTMGFSGFNTALEGIACGLPVVALEGEYLRGRFAAGALRQAGTPDTVASDEQEFIEKAIRLGLDGDWRAAICAKLRQGEAGLYSDRRSIDALEQFLREATRAPQSAHRR